MPTWYLMTEAAVLGAITASFLCVVAERVPKGQGIGGRSRCACGRQLAWRENLPVVGWVAARGRARCCGARIPVYYLAAEIGLAAAWAAAAWIGGAAGVAAAAAAAGAVLLAGVAALKGEPGR